MLHSLAFNLALITVPAVAIFVLQRVIKPAGPYQKKSFSSAWHIVAIATAALGVLLSHAFTNPVTANFVMHAIGGGVVSFLLMMHVVRQLKLDLTWSQLATVVLGAVCVLGVANELFEYALELALPGQILFSWDTHDTWRDLAANLVGSAGAFGAYRVFKLIRA